MSAVPFALIGGFWLMWFSSTTTCRSRRPSLYRAGRRGSGIRIIMLLYLRQRSTSASLPRNV